MLGRRKPQRLMQRQCNYHNISMLRKQNNNGEKQSDSLPTTFCNIIENEKFFLSTIGTF